MQPNDAVLYIGGCGLFLGVFLLGLSIHVIDKSSTWKKKAEDNLKETIRYRNIMLDEKLGETNVTIKGEEPA